MATTVARLEAVLTAQTRDFDRAMNRSEGRMKSLGKTAGLVAGGTALGAIGFALRAGVHEWMTHQKVAAQTEAVLKSTGGVAHVTAKQVEDLATTLMKKTGVDDEVIQTGENMLLTFTKVRNEVGKGNDIFTQATKVGIDMSTALEGAGFEGGNLQTVMIRLGKALQDPVLGLTALRRVGVDTTELMPKIKALMGGTGLTAEQAAKGIKKAQAALEAANASAASAARGLQSAQDAQANAARGLTSAQDHLADANQRLADSQQKLKDSTLAVKDAKDKLRDAQNRARSAQEALTEARKRAADELRDLKNAAVDASLSERSATLAVQRAQENLNKVMADATSTDLDKQEAILGLDEANQNLTEAQQRAKDAQKEADEGTKKGIDGTEAMKQAREEQLAAEKAVADAQRDLVKQLAGVQKAQEGVAKAQRGQNAAQRSIAAAHDRVAAADRGLAAAEENVAASNKKVADAQAALTNAQKAAEPVHKNSANLLKAQRLILAELRTEFGGSAEAAGKTFAGQIKIAHETVNNFMGDLVEKSIPIIQLTIEWLRDHWPEITTAMKTFWKDVKPGLEGLYKLMSAIYTFTRDHWAQIGPIVKMVSDIVGAAMKILGGELKIIAALLRGDWAGAWNEAKGVLKAMGQLIESYFRPQVALLKVGFEQLTTAGVTVWNKIKAAAEAIIKPFDKALGSIQKAAAGLRGEFATLWHIFKKIIDGLKWLIDNVKKIGGALGGIGGAVGGVAGRLNPLGEGEGAPAGGPGFPGGSGNMGSIVQAANVIDSKHFPYLWGGGHSASTYGGPYDCSGAVSAILRAGGLLRGSLVSGDFMNWGRAGMGKHLSILANKEHVYAIINGKAWGTSGQNPHGGAGWFSGGVRPGFAIRHPEGFDTGGWLKPGLTLAVNNTGRPERVVSGNGDNVVIPVNIGGENVATIIFDMLRRKAKVFENRNGRPAFGGA